MGDLDRIARAAGAEHLAILGGLHPEPQDDLGNAGTLLLLGPAEPGFWRHFTAQPEWRDGAPDPLDRWSARVVGALADAFGGAAHFPFGGPPYRPFYSWARRSGRAWASPVTLLVHDSAGLMVSYRGALALPGRLNLPAPPAAPCGSCAEKPCLTACPAGALTAAGYDVPACHAFLDGPDGTGCLSRGCAVRRACPVSQSYARVAEQSAYHMGLFHR
ncbi:ferredoxin [Acidimangrovimonas pyrenivorans]|uniref:Ferredoxin n=1 Tax=Acidimangrovimonas pyrenivorans TaxID=2030798 RepID=A0ABV7AJZ8_9RHOB